MLTYWEGAQMTQIIQNYNNIFWKQIKNYDLNESNILRKVIHSFDVAKTCFEVACNKKLNIKKRWNCSTAFINGMYYFKSSTAIRRAIIFSSHLCA